MMEALYAWLAALFTVIAAVCGCLSVYGWRVRARAALMRVIDEGWTVDLTDAGLREVERRESRVGV